MHRPIITELVSIISPKNVKLGQPLKMPLLVHGCFEIDEVLTVIIFTTLNCRHWCHIDKMLLFRTVNRRTEQCRCFSSIF